MKASYVNIRNMKTEQGASTITQQLLKNILWLNKDERGFYDTVVRKHKEWLLVGKLADVIKSDVRKKFPNESSE